MAMTKPLRPTAIRTDGEYFWLEGREAEKSKFLHKAVMAYEFAKHGEIAHD